MVCFAALHGLLGGDKGSGFGLGGGVLREFGLGRLDLDAIPLVLPARLVVKHVEVFEHVA